jgi:hypothetical protein
MSMGAWVLLQVWLGGSWGVGGPAWQSYGTQLRKSSGLNAPRALVQVLNGADSKDLPYQTDNPRAAGWGDSLVSPCLNTENAPKLYVHFAYQRGGLMDPPESNDTLRLWGLRADGTWQVLWDTIGTGQVDSTFLEHTLQLEDSVWRHRCFRLRWAVYGSIYGAYDNWLLAYTAVTADSLLSGTYWRFIPRTYWGRYGIVPHYLADRIRDSLVTAVMGAPGEVGVFTYQQPNGTFLKTVSLSGGIDTVRWPPILGPFADTLSQMELRYECLPTNELWVDTTAVGRWIGYDDGEMEQGYGLSVANRAFIQVFQLDTLVALDRVAIRFFPVPTQVGRPFQLGIWLLAEGRDPVYLRFHRVSLDTAGGGFVEYPLDTVLWVRGRIGVGFIQADNQPLGVGWDGSYREEPVVYRDSAGFWVPSRKEGCLMVRLGLVPQSLLGLSGVGEPRGGWWLRPVPARAGMPVQLCGQWAGEITLWSTEGKMLRRIAQETFEAPSTPGVYLVQDALGRTYKLLVLP